MQIGLRGAVGYLPRMILDRIEHWERYAGLHPLFREAFAYLLRPDLASTTVGRHAVLGDRLYASIEERDGRGRDGARIEAHRTYIDIQFTVRGTDVMGWRPLADCASITEPYDESRDVAFYGDRPATWLVVPAGYFAIFFPEDGHAPLAGEGPLKKVVMKIAM